MWGKAKQAIEGDDVPLASVANKAQSDSYEVQPDTARNLPIDGATLVELRRAAAGIESAERGITFTVNADGKAIGEKSNSLMRLLWRKHRRRGPAWLPEQW